MLKCAKFFYAYKLQGIALSGLVASGLSCIKRDRVLFSELSISLNVGQLIYLRGPNGAGKTSLLRILTGLSEPAEGVVMFNGEPWGKVAEAYHKQLLYIGHKPALNGAFSALENLRFWCYQQQLSVTELTIFHVLEKLGLVGVEEVPVRYLSAGQQRRVALSRLWLKSATFWILDEPFTALDAEGVAMLERHFCQHVANGGGIITTSHQPLSELSGPYDNFTLEYQL